MRHAQYVRTSIYLSLFYLYIYRDSAAVESTSWGSLTPAPMTDETPCVTAPEKALDGRPALIMLKFLPIILYLKNPIMLDKNSYYAHYLTNYAHQNSFVKMNLKIINGDCTVA